MNCLLRRISIAWGICCLATESLAVPPAALPNVVIIYGDDVGFADIGVNGGPDDLPTPNIDRLAQEGINFTDAHSPAATCTPSRFSMLTGVLAYRHKVNILPPNGHLIIPTDYKTLPALFRDAGYATGIIGKWHLGFGAAGEQIDWNGELKPGPMEVGFDHAFLLPNTNDRVPCVYIDGRRVLNLDRDDPIHVGDTLASVTVEGSTAYPDARAQVPTAFYQSIINGLGRIGYTSGGKSALWDDATMADVFVDRAAHFIEINKDRPFFLYFSSQDIHYPYTPNERFHEKSNYGMRGDAMVQLDWTVGKIMQILERHSLSQNTIVIFTSDNGPVNFNDDQSGVVGIHSESNAHDASGVWRGGKFQIYEGGTRVPLITRWPTRIPANQSSDATLSQLDFLASFAKLLGHELEPDDAIDSCDRLDAILGVDSKGADVLIEECRGLAIRSGQWKYIPSYKNRVAYEHDPKSDSLFNLRLDPGERTNVIQEHPEVVDSLRGVFERISAGAGVRQLTNDKIE